MTFLRPVSKRLAPVLAAVAIGAASMVPTYDAIPAEPDPMASVFLSTLMPGVGEWYNAGFSGGFPFVECLLGEICPCIRVASIVDSAAGRTDDAIRFDFWSSPN